MTTRLVPWGLDLELRLVLCLPEAGQTMAEMTPVQCHNAQSEHSTPESTPETTQIFRDPQAPLRGVRKWWRTGRQRETEGFGYNEEKQNWRLEGSEEQFVVRSR